MYSNIIWTTLSFIALFLLALGGYPFNGAEQITVAGGCVGIASGVAWGVSVHGSRGWTNVLNWIAALAALMSLAYLSANTFETEVCKVDHSEHLCQASQFLIHQMKTIVDALTHWL